MTGRGPDYADRLTEAERRTLDGLLAEVEGRGTAPQPAEPRSWRTPIVTGLAALAILLAATVAGQLSTPSPPVGPPPASSTGVEPAVAVLQDLAAAAARAPAPSGPADEAHRHRLDVTLSPAAGAPDHCQVAALTIQTWERVDQSLGPTDHPGRVEPLRAQLAVQNREPPAAAAPLAGCSTIAMDTLAPQGLYFAGDVLEGWEELAHELDGLAPRYLPLLIVEADPQGATPPERIDEALADTGGSDEGWWAALVRLLASPQPAPEVAAAALTAAAQRAAAAPGSTAELLGPGTDVAGRSGITIRLPYSLDGQPTTTELTFDPDTGRLLQQVTRADGDTAVTAYLAVEWR